MPRQIPTEKLDVVGTFDMEINDGVQNYLDSKMQNEYFIKPPAWDQPSYFQRVAIDNSLEYSEMMGLQEEIEHHIKAQKALNALRIKEMFKVQHEMKQKFIASNVFLKDCDDKRNASIRHVNEEKQKCTAFTEKINKAQSDVDELRDFKNVLISTIEEFKPYEVVTLDYINNHPFLGSVEECILQCDALMTVSDECNVMEDKSNEKLLKIRKELTNFLNNSAMTVLGLNNELASMERSFKKLRTDCLKWEKILANINDKIAENRITSQRSMDCIYQIYRLVCRRKEADIELGVNDVEGSLDFIREEFHIIRAVLSKFQNNTQDN